MGKVAGGVKCSVEGCETDAVRSMAFQKVKTGGLNVKPSPRAYLCKLHYKEFKKRTRKENEIERWRHMG